MPRPPPFVVRELAHKLCSEGNDGERVLQPVRGPSRLRDDVSVVSVEVAELSGQIAAVRVSPVDLRTPGLGTRDEHGAMAPRLEPGRLEQIRDSALDLLPALQCWLSRGKHLNGSGPANSLKLRSRRHHAREPAPRHSP